VQGGGYGQGHGGKSQQEGQKQQLVTTTHRISAPKKALALESAGEEQVPFLLNGQRPLRRKSAAGYRGSQATAFRPQVADRKNVDCV
jgi:hypothetical protein